MSALGGNRTLQPYAAPVTVYRPRLGFWLPLIIPTLLFIFIGIASLIDGGFVEGLAILAFAAVVVGYNASTRLSVDGEEISFRRYGRTLWRVKADGLCVTSGRAGEVPILPAFILTDEHGRRGAVPKNMLAPSAAAGLKSAIEQQRGVWKA